MNIQVTTETIDLWFDAACPFAWLTSRWVEEVAALRPVEVRWHPMSLVMVNEDVNLSDERRARLAGVERGPRVALVVGRDHGNDALGRYYTAIGTRLHVDQRPFSRELVEEALEEAGLPQGLADAMDDASLDAEVRLMHDEGQAAVGHKTGTPVVVLDGGHGFFGPVVSVLPRGDDALRLYDGLRLVQSVESFAELKRSRDALVFA